MVWVVSGDKSAIGAQRNRGIFVLLSGGGGILGSQLVQTLLMYVRIPRGLGGVPCQSSLFPTCSHSGTITRFKTTSGLFKRECSH